MKAFSLKNTFAAAGLAVLASASVAQAAPACGAKTYYKTDDLAVLAHNDAATIRSLTADIARGAVEHAFDRRASKDAFLQQSKKALLNMVKRLPEASVAERTKIAQDAYKLRLTLESRNFAYHYAMAAQTVSRAAEGSDLHALDGTLMALGSVTIYDLGRVTHADLRKPYADVAKEAEALCVKDRGLGKWMLLNEIGHAKAERDEQAVIAKAVSHLKPL